MTTTQTQMPPAYSPEEVEQRLYNFWLENKCFEAKAKAEAEIAATNKAEALAKEWASKAKAEA